MTYLDHFKAAEDALVKDGLQLARQSVPFHRRLLWKSDAVEPAVRREAQRLMKFLFLTAATQVKAEDEAQGEVILGMAQVMYADFQEEKLSDFRNEAPGEVFGRNIYERAGLRPDFERHVTFYSTNVPKATANRRAHKIGLGRSSVAGGFTEDF
jgi:hypothetical protein